MSTITKYKYSNAMMKWGILWYFDPLCGTIVVIQVVGWQHTIREI